ncbi:MAG: Xaa-Pro dipeptidase [Thermoanaerobaculia bacterium]
MSLEQSYRQHLETVDGYLVKAVEAANRQDTAVDGVLLHAGRACVYHADDRAVPFQACGHFRRWVPLEGPEHVVLARPGRQPRVARVRPRDYWYDTSPPPASYWEQSVDLVEVTSFEEAVEALGSLERIAYIGDSKEAAAEAGIAEELIEPQPLLLPLDWFRAYKTEHEVALIRRAAEAAAAGHHAAHEAFDSGASEFQTHHAYLVGSGQIEYQNPYDPIIAFDDKAAILHYQNKRGAEAAPGRVFLIDAGATCDGYAADITRTWTRAGVDEVFLALVRGVDAFQRDLVAMVTAGRPFLELHEETHRRTARLMAEIGLLESGADEAFDRGVTRTFLPHGLGHHIGTQVHDVGGHQAGRDGGEIKPPEEYPFLRNTRILEPGHVVTIEPGIYFVPMLLAPLRQSAEADLVDWALVDRLTPLGGVRIEDNVHCTADGPVDLTRDLIPGP